MVNEKRQSQFEVRDESERLITEADRVLTLLKNILPDKKTKAKLIKLNKTINKERNIKVMARFEQLVFSIIEQAGDTNANE